MINSERIALNTSILYLKMPITTILALFSTRIILKELGVEDYGIYSLISGVIALFSFLNSAMTISSQRYMSICIGEKNAKSLLNVFNSSVVLHCGLAIIVVIILELLFPFLFSGFLNIPENKIYDAKIIYQLMILSTVVTFIGIPLNAAINAHEHMWFFAVTSIFTELGKLIAACYIMYIGSNLLITYAFLIFIISFANLFIRYLWCRTKYKEIRIIGSFEKKLTMEMMGFAGWNTLGAMSQVIRGQGIAVLLNVFFGAAINAAYGIVNQINSLLVYFSTTMTMAITPQIMQAKGENNLERMNNLSTFASKLSFYLASIFALPILFEVTYLLTLWLATDIPEYTVAFSRYTIITFLIMQLYPGLVRAIQANGDIKNYQISISILLISPVIIGAFLYHYTSGTPNSIFIITIVAQIFTLITTVYFAKRKLGINIFNFIKDIVVKPLLIFCISVLMCLPTMMINNDFLRLITITMMGLICLSSGFYYIVLNLNERDKIKLLGQNIYKKILKR